jgi:hypothetical protein
MLHAGMPRPFAIALIAAAAAAGACAHNAPPKPDP